MGRVNSKGDPKASFLLSWIKREVAARVLRHGTHPLVVGSNCLERYPTGVKEGPMCVPELLGQTLASQKRKGKKGRVRSGRRSAMACNKACKRVSK
jgi:hypothetical protein